MGASTAQFWVAIHVRMCNTAVPLLLSAGQKSQMSICEFQASTKFFKNASYFILNILFKNLFYLKLTIKRFI